jgi:hypothetical protein
MTTESRQLEEFWNFLASWFPDADLEGFDNDEDVVQSFIDTGNAATVSAVYGGCRQVLRSQVLPWERISEEANRFFESETECRSWLTTLTQVLAKEMSARPEE